MIHVVYVRETYCGRDHKVLSLGHETHGVMRQKTGTLTLRDYISLRVAELCYSFDGIKFYVFLRHSLFFLV